MRIRAIKIIVNKFGKENSRDAVIVVHGDTISTLLGAHIGKKLNMKVCHVEAGLRSHHLLNPFPEEIDRLLTSRFAQYHFAPGNEAVENLKKVRGTVINTKYNTIIDSLDIAKQVRTNNEKIKAFYGKDYFVFVMHRQENLLHREFFLKCIEEVTKLAKKRHCVMILHTPTRMALEKNGKLNELQNNSDFTLFPRIDYFDFMKLLWEAKFVITDGGSNQEELSYMGKPTLLMRKTTERKDGLGENAHLFDGDVEKILQMNDTYKKWERERVVLDFSPSEIIAEMLYHV